MIFCLDVDVLDDVPVFLEYVIPMTQDSELGVVLVENKDNGFFYVYFPGYVDSGLVRDFEDKFSVYILKETL